MRKGFVQNIIILGIAALFMSGVTAFQYLKSQPARFTAKPASHNLGSITTSGSFPTSTNSFQDGDIINAGDWNAIERWLGTRTSTNTDSVSYKLINASSMDPGHQHSANAISSGTLAVARGGTGVTSSSARYSSLVSTGNAFETTSTVPVPAGGTGTSSLTASSLIVGNGTGPVTFLAPGTAGNFAKSDGTNWVSTSSVTAGAVTRMFLPWLKGSSNATETLPIAFATGLRGMGLIDGADSYVNASFRLGIGQSIATATVKFSSDSGANTDYRLTMDFIGFPDGSGSTVSTDDSSGAVLVTNGNAACGAGGVFCEWNLASSAFNGLTAGRSYVARLLRQGSHASDTSTGIAQSVGLELVFQ